MSPRGTFLGFSLILISSLFALGIAEFSLRKLDFQYPGFARYLAKERHFYFSRGDRSDYDISPLFHPRLGWRGMENADPGLNKQGWRHSLDYTPRSNKIRIILVGDSTVYGVGLAWKDTINYQLQNRLGDRYEVLNISAPAYSMDQIIYASTEEAFLYSPDVVFASLIGNDVQRSCMGYSWIPADQPFYLAKDDGRFELIGVPQIELGTSHKKNDLPLFAKVQVNLSRSRVVSGLLEPFFERRYQRCLEDRGRLLQDAYSRVGKKAHLFTVLLQGNFPPAFLRGRPSFVKILDASKERKRLSMKLNLTPGVSDIYSHPDASAAKMLSEFYAEIILSAPELEGRRIVENEK